MIATLSGRVSEKLSEVVIVETGGVGYGVLVPLEDYGQLASGEKVKLYIYEHIRENSHDLYGFTKLDTKKLFQQLLDVNGIGPKMALNILSIGSVEDVRNAIAGGDTKLIKMAPGVGKRVAERLIVDLKDKVGLASTADTGSILSGGGAYQDEAMQALIGLGYSSQDAASALSKIDKDLSTEERIRQALKGRL